MTTLIGPYGYLQVVKSPQAPLSVAGDRPSTSMRLISGQVRTQRAPLASREWSWKIRAASTTDLLHLTALEQGVYGPGPLRWYDTYAARFNMLPAQVAAAGIGEGPWRWLAAAEGDVTAAGPLTTADGKPVQYSVTPTQHLSVPHRNAIPDPVPVVEGRTYTASAHFADGSGWVGLAWCNQAGAVTATTYSSYGTGRRSVSAAAPAGTHGVLLRIEVGTLGQALTVAAGNAGTPDHASLDITGDIDVRVEAALDDTTTGAIQSLASKWVTPSDRSWWFYVTAAGELGFSWSSNGTNSFSATSSVVLPAAGLTGYRATIDVDNGASGRTIKFYTSPDWSTWTQLGADVVGAGVTSIFSSAAPVRLGVRGTSLADPMRGEITRAEIRSSIGGTAVANPDFRSPGNGWLAGDNSGTSARNDAAGRAWTLGGDGVIAQAVAHVTGARAGALQLTETATAPDWHPGVGIPHVSIAGFKEVLRSAYADDTLRDYDIKLVEET